MTEPSLSAELIHQTPNPNKSQGLISLEFRFFLLKVTHSRDGLHPSGLPITSGCAIEDNCLDTR